MPAPTKADRMARCKPSRSFPSAPLLGMADEFMVRAKAVSSIGIPTLNSINATGRFPASDSGGASIAQIGAKLDRLIDVVYSSGTIQAGHLASVKGSTAVSAEMAQVGGWR